LDPTPENESKIVLGVCVMNERFEEQIFELAKQAGMLRDKFGLYWNAHDNPDDGVDLEKFAELIVRECAEVITETRWHLPPTQQQIADGIKEHFGVNE
jgi:hypothetical protein